MLGSSGYIWTRDKVMPVTIENGKVIYRENEKLSRRGQVIITEKSKWKPRFLGRHRVYTTSGGQT